MRAKMGGVRCSVYDFTANLRNRPLQSPRPGITNHRRFSYTDGGDGPSHAHLFQRRFRRPGRTARLDAVRRLRRFGPPRGRQQAGLLVRPPPRGRDYRRVDRLFRRQRRGPARPFAPPFRPPGLLRRPPRGARRRRRHGPGRVGQLRPGPALRGRHRRRVFRSDVRPRPGLDVSRGGRRRQRGRGGPVARQVQLRHARRAPSAASSAARSSAASTWPRATSAPALRCGGRSASSSSAPASVRCRPSSRASSSPPRSR